MFFLWPGWKHRRNFDAHSILSFTYCKWENSLLGGISRFCCQGSFRGMNLHVSELISLSKTRSVAYPSAHAPPTLSHTVYCTIPIHTEIPELPQGLGRDLFSDYSCSEAIVPCVDVLVLFLADSLASKQTEQCHSISEDMQSMSSRKSKVWTNPLVPLLTICKVGESQLIVIK